MKVFLVDGKRTAFGKFGGSYKSVTPVDLAVDCAQSLLDSLKISAKDMDHFILGNVLPSMTDTFYGARHLGLKLGGLEETPGYLVNRLCGSGIQAIGDAVSMIKNGEAQAVLSAGVENMSLAPHLVYGGRFGTKYGALKSADMLLDSLTDQYAGCPMAITAENLAAEYGITREECDQFALESHQKAAKAYEQGLLQGEIGTAKLKLALDEHLRTDAKLAEMSALKPSFKADGVVTAANASGIVDGAASVVVASEAFVLKHKLSPIAEIIDMSVVGVPPRIMGIGPVNAIKNLLAKHKLDLTQIDIIEINEAFAAQTIACQKALQLPMEKINRWGGAIALGHPLAASGVRISLTAARQMQHYKAKTAIASACIGGGQGIALLMRACN